MMMMVMCTYLLYRKSFTFCPLPSVAFPSLASLVRTGLGGAGRGGETDGRGRGLVAAQVETRQEWVMSVSLGRRCLGGELHLSVISYCCLSILIVLGGRGMGVA